MSFATVTESDVIRDVYVVEPTAFGDSRGRFVESYRRSWFPHGREMVQGNRSDKTAGTVVGLHYHLHQADYWYFTKGDSLVVLHDLREGSPVLAAEFLREFAGEGPWAHVDMAGPGFLERSRGDYMWQRGATGYGVRLLVELAQRYS